MDLAQYNITVNAVEAGLLSSNPPIPGLDQKPEVLVPMGMFSIIFFAPDWLINAFCRTCRSARGSCAARYIPRIRRRKFCHWSVAERERRLRAYQVIDTLVSARDISRPPAHSRDSPVGVSFSLLSPSGSPSGSANPSPSIPSSGSAATVATAAAAALSASASALTSLAGTPSGTPSPPLANGNGNGNGHPEHNGGNGNGHHDPSGGNGNGNNGGNGSSNGGHLMGGQASTDGMLLSPPHQSYHHHHAHGGNGNGNGNNGNGGTCFFMRVECKCMAECNFLKVIRADTRAVRMAATAMETGTTETDIAAAHRPAPTATPRNVCSSFSLCVFHVVFTLCFLSLQGEAHIRRPHHIEVSSCRRRSRSRTPFQPRVTAAPSSHRKDDTQEIVQ